MKIAHWRSQHLHPGEQLDYSNLLGACMGDKGDPPSSQSCDTSQGDRDVKWNPAEPGHGIDNRIRYLEDGTIKSDDAEFNEQITRILNLNSKFLTNSRRGLLEVFLKSLGSKGLKRRPLEKLLREWNGESDNDQLEPYCQIIVCWLRKRLARA
jgi:hypothetical protein